MRVGIHDLQNLQVKFVYQGHQVKVTGEKCAVYCVRGWFVVD